MDDRLKFAIQSQTHYEETEPIDECFSVKLYDVSDRLYTKPVLGGNQYLSSKTQETKFRARSLDTRKMNLPRSYTGREVMEIWNDTPHTGSKSSRRYIETVDVKYDEHILTFPVFRWIEPSHSYMIYGHDAYLPQNDPNNIQRAKELEEKLEEYKLEYQDSFPIMLKKFPADEDFSYGYQVKLAYEISKYKTEKFFESWFTGPWKKLKDVTNIYGTFYSPKPKACAYWKEDTTFGYQRLNGCNPKSIKLCEKIPSKLCVNDKIMKSVLHGKTLKGLIKKKRLFYTDLEILEGITHNEKYDLCAPIALFMLNSEDNLVPIAIQLQQNKGDNNPVFLPTDDWGVWTLAKMWYNMADASYHQSIVHLGLTHVLMQIVVIQMHRNISISHPIYKILSPHTLYLLAINERAFGKLISPGGFIDETMTIGSSGALKLVHEGLQHWNFFRDGIPANDFKNRKVDDPKVLPKYYFRDDSLVLYNCIYKYVSRYIDVYYDNKNDIIDDWELHNWIESMAIAPKDGGILGLPMKDGIGHVSSKDELKWILAVIIYTCSVSHAAVNFLQYEEYGFPANYPSMLRTPLLRDKSPRTEEDILDALPSKETTLKIIAITRLLSGKETNSLGDFETQYIFDPRAKVYVEKFRSDLKKIDEEFRKRNKTQDKPYTVLNPENIPNAISI